MYGRMRPQFTVSCTLYFIFFDLQGLLHKGLVRNQFMKPLSFLLRPQQNTLIPTKTCVSLSQVQLILHLQFLYFSFSVSFLNWVTVLSVVGLDPFPVLTITRVQRNWSISFSLGCKVCVLFINSWVLLEFWRFLLKFVSFGCFWFLSFWTFYMFIWRYNSPSFSVFLEYPCGYFDCCPNYK